MSIAISRATRSSVATSKDGAVSALDVWAFVLPAFSFIQITLIGQLIASEILALAMLPWLWGARDRLPIPRWFVVLCAGWFVSQIVTDLVVGSLFADYARGWAAIAFTFTDFAAVLVLVSTQRRARLFALGLAAGGVVGYLIVPNVYAAGDPWKWALAIPVGFTLAAVLSGSIGARRRWLTASAFMAFGAVNLWLGYRSLGGVSLLTAGYLILRIALVRRGLIHHRAFLRSVGGLVFLALAVAGTLQLYDAAASQGLLGSDAQAKYHSESGSLGVLIGGRSEFLASSQAVVDSPLIGHGSWAKDLTYVTLLTNRLDALGYEIGAGASDLGLIPAHSYLMQSWVWAGLMGGLFWLAALAIATWLLADPWSMRLDVSPLIVFSTMLLIWDIAFSPYGSGARFLACYGLAVCLMGLHLVRSARSAHPAGASVAQAAANRGHAGDPGTARTRSVLEQPASGE